MRGGVFVTKSLSQPPTYITHLILLTALDVLANITSTRRKGSGGGWASAVTELWNVWNFNFSPHKINNSAHACSTVFCSIQQRDISILASTVSLLITEREEFSTVLLTRRSYLLQRSFSPREAGQILKYLVDLQASLLQSVKAHLPSSLCRQT